MAKKESFRLMPSAVFLLFSMFDLLQNFSDFAPNKQLLECFPLCAALKTSFEPSRLLLRITPPRLPGR